MQARGNIYMAPFQNSPQRENRDAKGGKHLMKVRIINVLGDWKISTETGAFYPGTYPTYGDAARKCEMNGYEIVKEIPEKEMGEPGNANSAVGMAALMQKTRDLPQVKIYPGRVKWDVFELFTDGQKRRLISAQEAAEILGISTQHISNLIDEGRIAALDISSRGALRKMWRIVPQSLSDLIINSLCAAPEDLGLSNVPKKALENLRERINEHLKGAESSWKGSSNG